MRYWKLGTRWGEKAPDFHELVKSRSFALSHLSDTKGYYPQTGEVIIITLGHTVKAIGILLETMQEVTVDPSLEEQFKEYGIEYSDDVLFGKVDWMELEPSDYFSYKLVDGICEVQQPSTIEQTRKLIDKYKVVSKMKNLIELLNHKKQIILQGPPGTGKTRLAKMLGENLTRPKEISEADIDRLIKPGLVISSATNYNQYRIVSVNERVVKIKLPVGSEYEPVRSKIIHAYQNQLWKGGQKNGLDPYEAAIAKYIFENISKEYIKLIQFHPGYSYEDFVRGIVAKTNGAAVEYKTEDKVLADVAAKALKNYIDSKKDPEVQTREKEVDNLFEKFVEVVQEEFLKSGKYELTSYCYVFEIENDAFRYTGENWSSKFRMPYELLKRLYLAGIRDRNGVVNTNLSGRASKHATYYFTMLERFIAFASSHISEKEFKKTDEQKYVLVIDEINRANLPSVLGELIYALEYRGEEVESMYELEDYGRRIVLPPNLLIIGTMNSADRSVGHIDYAIRRRFAFVEVLPTIDPIHQDLQTYFKQVSELFISNYDQIVWSAPSTLKRSEYLAPDFRPEDVWIGHSYFITQEKDPTKIQAEFKLKWNYEILPLLKEYLKDGVLLSNAEEIIHGINF